MSADNRARTEYYRLLDHMNVEIATAHDDNTGFSRSTIALLNVKKLIDQAIDHLAAWELAEMNRRANARQIAADVEAPADRPVLTRAEGRSA